MRVSTFFLQTIRGVKEHGMLGKEGDTYSTSAGRKYRGSTFTTTLPVLVSTASSSTPSPRHLLMSQLMHNEEWSKAG